MKKLILLFVCALLSFTFVNASDVSEIKTASSDTQLEVVTLDLVFSSFVGVSYDEYGNRYEGNCVQFHCPNAWQYGIDQIDVYIHNVTTPSENNATVWVQMIDGGHGYSEMVPCTLTAGSYVDRSMIRVTSTNPNYVFYFLNSATHIVRNKFNDSYTDYNVLSLSHSKSGLIFCL